jgi:hypothetical protein
MNDPSGAIPTTEPPASRPRRQERATGDKVVIHAAGACAHCGGKLRWCACGFTTCTHVKKHVSSDSVYCEGGLP